LSRSITYGRQKIDEDDIEAVIRVLRSDYITQGPMMERFEEALKGYCGAGYAVLFNSGHLRTAGAYFCSRHLKRG
jgi:dTDP-4-amino-4,6-dideoxygalactose transaminase